MVEKVYPIVEIFQSIQGEGSYMGCPVTFVRLAGCNLQCEWCDTNFTSFRWYTLKEILSQIPDKYPVVFTGGEPLIHDLLPILAYLSGQYVMLETNGTFPTEHLRSFVDWIVCSPKPEVKYQIAEGCIFDELKYVVDNNFNPEIIPKDFLQKFSQRIWLQPESSDMANKLKEAYEIAMKYPELRVGIQLHKILEVR